MLTRSHQFLKTKNYICEKTFKKRLNKQEPLKRFENIKSIEKIQKKLKTKDAKEEVIKVLIFLV